MSTLLVVDDDVSILELFTALFCDAPIGVVTAASAAEAVAAFARQRPDAVVLDVGLPDQSGLETFHQMHRLDPRVPVVFLTGEGTTDTAIGAMAHGAHDYVLKPASIGQLRRVVDRALEAGRLARTTGLPADDGPSPGAWDILVGRSEAMQEVYKSIGRAAPQMVTVLILGESGTGKELVARAIHDHSRRADAVFVAVNCAAIPETLLESELFGHEKGAFTGADRRHVGKFEQCSGGTLFLDEIGDMTPLTQAKVLRVLQDQQFGRLGGSEIIQTDVRLIAATNRDLSQMVADGLFRRDLYYRLNVYSIRLPPLRERMDDLPLLIDHFLRRFRRELDKEIHGVTLDAMALLRRHPWPGNLRELQSVLKHAMLQSTVPLLLAESFLPVFGEAPGCANPDAVPSTDLDSFIESRLREGSRNLYAEWRDRIDQRLFAHVLRHARGNLSLAAKVLGIHRATLRGRLAALGISVEKPTDEGGI